VVVAETSQATPSRRPTTHRESGPQGQDDGASTRAGLSGIAWRIGVGVAWMFAVLLAYYAVHKPFTAGDLAALRQAPVGASGDAAAVVTRLLNALGDVLAALWLLLLAGALGQLAWRGLRLPAQNSAEARLTGTILGLGLLGLAAFALGLVGLLTRPAAFILLGAPTLALAGGMLAQAHWWARVVVKWWRAGTRSGPVEQIVLAFSLATLVLILFAALLPPTAAWDALSYHLVAVRADASAGRLVLDPGNPQLYQPQLTEMLYTLLYLVRSGDGAAAVLHAGCGVLAVAYAALWGWRAAGPRGGVRAAALALAIPAVALLASWPYVDLALAACELAALAALSRWHDALLAGDHTTARSWLVVSGLSAGVALDMKYTAAYAVAALALLIVLASWRQQSAAYMVGARVRRMSWLPAALEPAVPFVGLALAAGSPWLLRNLFVTGDPFFPYHLGPLFPGGPGWDAGRTAFMQGSGWGWSALWRGPLLPLESVLLGQQGSSEFDATLGPLLLLLLPLGLLTLPWRRARRAPATQPTTPEVADSSSTRLSQLMYWPLGFAGVLALIWIEELARSGVAMQSRLFLALFLAVAGPAAVAWLRLNAVQLPGVSLNRLAGAAVVLCLALTLAAQAAQTLQPANLAELAGIQSSREYQAQQLGPYAEAMWRLDTLGPQAHVLFLWEPRSYLTHARVQPDVFLDAFNTLYRHCGDAVGIERCLRAQGFTHVLLYREGLHLLQASRGAKDSPAELATLDTLLPTWSIIYRDATPLVGAGPSGTGWYVLYSLEAGSAR
jgi:hypothetical protein